MIPLVPHRFQHGFRKLRNSYSAVWTGLKHKHYGRNFTTLRVITSVEELRIHFFIFWGNQRSCRRNGHCLGSPTKQKPKLGERRSCPDGGNVCAFRGNLHQNHEECSIFFIESQVRCKPHSSKSLQTHTHFCTYSQVWSFFSVLQTYWLWTEGQEALHD